MSFRPTFSTRAVDDRHDGDCNDDDGEWTTVDFKDLCVYAACVNIPGCWLLVILFGSPVATGMGWVGGIYYWTRLHVVRIGRTMEPNQC